MAVAEVAEELEFFREFFQPGGCATLLVGPAGVLSGPPTVATDYDVNTAEAPNFQDHTSPAPTHDVMWIRLQSQGTVLHADDGEGALVGYWVGIERKPGCKGPLTKPKNPKTFRLHVG